MNEEEIKEIIKSDLIKFIYALLDKCSAADLERSLEQTLQYNNDTKLENKYLLEYATGISNRLLDHNTENLKLALETVFASKSRGAAVFNTERPNDVNINGPKTAFKVNEKVDIDFNDLKEKVDKAIKTASEEELKSVEEEFAVEKALESLNSLKKHIPSVNVGTLVDILKNEVEAELTEEFKEKTRESILEERAEQNKEHKSSENDAEEKALGYIKSKLAEIKQQAEDMPSHFEEGDLISRGKLADIKESRAFPEALDKVFEVEPPPQEKTTKQVLEENGLDVEE